jgi:hypothetical protein
MDCLGTSSAHTVFFLSFFFFCRFWGYQICLSSLQVEIEGRVPVGGAFAFQVKILLGI